MSLSCTAQLTLLASLAILQVLHAHKTHQCVHDQLEEKQELRQINVNYENHPYDKTISFDDMNDEHTSRRLLSPSETSPIRISAYYDPVTISTTYLNTTQIDYIKSLVSSTIRYYSQFLNVVPVSGPFHVAARHCLEWYFTERESVINCVNYTETFVCGSVTIPQDHYPEDYLYDYPTSTTAVKLPGGPGVLDTDLLLYVSYTADGCGNYTLAYASPCTHDQYGRPVTGYVNICPGMFDQAKYWKMDLATLIHEVAHVAIMHPSLWYGFVDANGDSIPSADVFDTTDPMNDGLYYIISPKVKELARKHYNCPTLAGLPLENTGGVGSVASHWDEKYVHSSLMGATSWTALIYFTDFTFALMEDSGWYIVDYNYSEPFYWGENAGCELWSDQCVDSSSFISNYAQYYCHSLLDNGCTYDYAAPGDCLYYFYASAVPVEFRYFTDSTHGGPEASDFCPFRNTQLVGDYESVCWDGRGNTLTTDTYPLAQHYAINSRCVDIIDGIEAGYCFEHQCFGYDEINKQWNGVSITIDPTETVNCTRSEQPGFANITTKNVASIGADLNCPDIDAICGASSQPFACYWGHYSDDLSQCICSPGYTGSQCDTEDSSIEPELQLNVEPTPSPTSTSLCVEGFSQSFLNGEYTADGEWNFYPKWLLTGQGQYVFWNIYLHSWLVSDVTDTNSWWTYCNVSAWTPDITACNDHWYVWIPVRGTVELEPNAKTYRGPCTPAPIPVPTRSPSQIPTSTPTTFPTQIPTSPSKNPTQNPTTNPSKNPTKYPTKYPTQNPSKYPTSNPTRAPTVTGYTYPPSIYPTKNPSTNPTNNPSAQPSSSPSGVPSTFPIVSTKNIVDLLYRNISIDLQYINQTECDLSSFTDLVRVHTMDYLNDAVIVSVETVDVVNNINESLISIDYSISVEDETVNVLDQLETIIISENFKDSLMSILESNSSCDFVWMDYDILSTELIFSTTEDDGIDIYDNPDKPGKDDGIELLDWKNYNTVELVIVGAIGLGGLLIICVMIYCCVSCSNGDKDNGTRVHNANAASVAEFGRFSSPKRLHSDHNDAAFQKSLRSASRRKLDVARSQSPDHDLM